MVSEVQDLTRKEYELIRRLVYAKSGINLGSEKMQLVRARLGKRVRQGGFKSFRDYFRHVEQDASGEELNTLLDAMSTNTTHLFREMRHFDFLREVFGRWTADRTWRAGHSALRIWSAACSSGEEPYSIAMVAHDVLRGHPNIDLKILATDLSIQMLSKARLGLYETHRVGTVPAQLRSRYMVKVQDDGQTCLQVIPELRRTISFTRFNLMTPTFDFDRATQLTLVNKMAHHLHPGGYLMIGHSESLNGVDHPLAYVEPTTYRKN